MTRKKQRGFTIIELVIVLMVLAILMSLAMPELHHAFKRTRAVEAIQTMASLERVFKEHYNREGEYPHTDGGSNPTGDAGTKKRFETGRPGWNEIAFVSEADLWYRYSFSTTMDEMGRYTRLTIVAQGDTDGDGNVLLISRRYDSGALVAEILNDD